MGLPFVSINRRSEHHNIFSLSCRQCLVIYSFELFANLAQAHCSIRKNLVFWNLFLDNLSENYLEREAKSTLL